ncbi:hypothetical protein DUHN26_15690 [Helicobacter pylori]
MPAKDLSKLIEKLNHEKKNVSFKCSLSFNLSQLKKSLKM